ncbi:CYTH and CHAD domain-containing protein [Psychrobacter sp. SCQQ22]|uniref:CYTH and CHAD domain-containing protein n=1 Tax=Psychrobacter sp. SCQQ22 TaxID=2792059 RepID=UPI0018CE138F|nr:CYTH and CHAD domain-containing protein [Psychrobacter sp. SCQQ22]MBH0085734.1 CYTH and CHAD domain-containing protein [Psychrobacter sp. SCQQ22]
MQEIELKFLVPESRLKGLMRQAQVKSSQLTQLAAHYYDTPDQQLAKAGIGLRIRKEGESWVQTIKAGGDGIAARLEHNAVLDNEQVQAMLDANSLMPDLTIYKDTPIAPALSEFKLKKLAKTLTRLYVTDVQRTTRLLVEDSSDQIDNQVNNSIEIAYDYGEIIHGNDDAQREVIREIEFELISGDLDFLFMTAKNWCQRYKLCLSTVTKAERGGLLINGQNHSPAVSADLSQLNINKKISIPAFVRAAVHNCLLQILPNSSAIVAGSTDSDHILQLQIGIRRLLAALNAFASFSDEINPDWQPILKQTATLIDDYQELDYLANHIDPKLQKYGAPETNWTMDIDALKTKPIDAISVPDFQLTLLELIAFTMSDPTLEPQSNKLATDKIVKVLSKQYKKLLHTDEELGEGNNVESESMDLEDIDLEDVDLESTNSNLDTDDQADFELHQLKDLRYITEFCAPLLSKKGSKKRTERQLKCLLKAQKPLEKYHSYAQYQQRYQLKSAVDNNALYGAGWFAAVLKNDTKHSDKCLAKVRDRSIFW